MPLPLTISCYSKIQIGFTYLVPADPSSPGQRAVKRVCVCVCVFVSTTSVASSLGGDLLTVSSDPSTRGLSTTVTGVRLPTHVPSCIVTGSTVVLTTRTLILRCAGGSNEQDALDDCQPYNPVQQA